MTKKYQIDSIDVSSPCSEPWDKMKGSAKKRFCGSCNKDVFNLSEMPRRSAERLLRREDGSICVRFARSSDGTLLTNADRLSKIARRTGPIAAGLIAATLSAASSGYAQGGITFREMVSSAPAAEEQKIERVQAEPEDGDINRLTFSVLDQKGEAVAGARVELTEEKTKRYFFTTTDSEGHAEFNLLPKAHFELSIENPGFRPRRGKLQVSLLVEPTISITLQNKQYQMAWENDTYDYDVPVFYAVSKGDKEAFLAALSAGFDIDTKGGDDETALHVAVQEHQTELVEIILKEGADTEAKDDENRTAIVILAEDVGEGNEEVAKILRLLIAEDADIDKANSAGETMLMEAAYYDDPEIVEILLEAEADARLKDEDGETAYQKIDNEEIIEIFHRYGIFN